MDIVLIQSPCWGLYAPPLGLASLSAFLREKGYKVLVLDINVDMFYKSKEEYRVFWQDANHEFWRNESLVEKFFSDNYDLIEPYLKQICDSDAKVVGFSVYDTCMHFSLLLSRKIKEKNKEKIIVFGGPHCSRYMARELILSHESVDILVEGEGESTLMEIMQLAGKENKISFCPGSTVRTDKGIIDCGERELISSLDSLPFPDFSDYPMGNYIRKDVLPIATSRGCINRCIFCNEWPYWKKYRYKSGDYLFKEVKHQLALYPEMGNIEFYDSLLNGNLKELSILSELMIKEGIKIRWGGQAAIRKEMDSKLLNNLKKSGCGCLNYGLESGSQKVLDTIRKGFNIVDAERVIRETREAGIDVALNFMFGLPGETDEDFSETLKFVARNKDYINVVNPSPSFCGIAPGTYLYSHLEEFNIALPMDHGLFWRTNDNSNNYLLRIERFERFCNFVDSLGIKSTYPHTRLVDRHKIIGSYYFYAMDYARALEYYKESLEKEGEDRKVLDQIKTCINILNQP